MKFDNLEEKVMYYRKLSDYRLMPKTPVILFLDGKGFSKFTKKFDRPYDNQLINMMNETAKFLCENIEGCKVGYVQSDEISLFVSDFDTTDQSSWFSYRINKLCSIAASYATAKFNQLNLIHECEDKQNETHLDIAKKIRLAQFDCKAWNVPTMNDVFCWFLQRQIDCIRNSKQMAAQTKLSHTSLMGKNTDSQIEMLKDVFGIDWHNYSDGEKFGRFILKEKIELETATGLKFNRNKWFINDGYELTEEENKNKFLNKITPQL